MRALLTIGMVLLFTVVMAATPIEGFRGFKWGDPIGVLGASSLVEDGNLKAYEKRNDQLSAGAATLSRIRYVFYKDQLAGVFVNFEGYENFSVLLLSLKEKYGEPKKPNRYIDTYYWGATGDSVGRISFEYSDISKKGKLVYLSVDVMNKQAEDMKQQAKSAADSL